MKKKVDIGILMVYKGENMRGATGKQTAIRWAEGEYKRVMEVAEECGLTFSEFVRLCVMTETARRSMKPEDLSRLAEVFREGVRDWVKSAVDHEVRKREKKRS